MKNGYQLYFEGFQIGLPSGKETLLELSDWGIKKGEVHVLTGESGAGKSLTALAIAGLLTNRFSLRGSIFFQVREDKKLEINSCSADHLLSLRRMQIGLILQQPLSSFNPVKKIKDQLYERAYWKFPSSEEQRQKCHYALEKLELEDPVRILNSYPHQLSGGQLQRVAIAMATIVQPKLLIADEPNSALDKETGESISRLLVEQNKENGTSLLLITHDLSSAKKISDRITVLKDGQIQETIENRANHFFVQNTYTRDLFDKHEYFYHTNKWSVFQNQNQSFTKNPLNPEVKNLSVSYQSGDFFSKRREVKALKDISCNFNSPNTGILGRTGSGKSTLGKVLCGLLAPTKGYLRFDQKSFTKGLREKSFPNIQMVFQDPHSAFNPVRKLGVQLKGVDKKGNKGGDYLIQMMEQSGLHPDLLDRKPSQLSGGQLQRISIIRALLNRPDGIIFDEFVTALDIHWKIEITKMVNDLVYKAAIPYWIISHEEAVLKKLCREIIRLESGVIEDVTFVEQNSSIN